MRKLRHSSSSLGEMLISDFWLVMLLALCWSMSHDKCCIIIPTVYVIDCRDGISVVYKAINDLIIFIAGSDECDELLCKYP